MLTNSNKPYYYAYMLPSDYRLSEYVFILGVGKEINQLSGAQLGKHHKLFELLALAYAFTKYKKWIG
jgi:hypothetical protein